MLVTTLGNLSIYFQEGARRRHIKDEPEYDRIADYQSSNDAYVIEDFGLVALVENIEEAA
ncbi:Phage major capsid protein, P2 family [compost metagenome]